MLNYLINCSLFNKMYSARTCMSAHYEIMLASPVLRDGNNVLKRGCSDLCRFVWWKTKSRWHLNHKLLCVSGHREVLLQVLITEVCMQAWNLGILHIQTYGPLRGGAQRAAACLRETLTHSCSRPMRLSVAIRFGLCNKSSSEVCPGSIVVLHQMLPHSHQARECNTS